MPALVRFWPAAALAVSAAACAGAWGDRAFSRLVRRDVEPEPASVEDLLDSSGRSSSGRFLLSGLDSWLESRRVAGAARER